MMPRRAFTLLDLLIVVLILGLLAALLFPVLVSARAASRRAETAHEDRMAALAELADAEDADGAPELAPTQFRSPSFTLPRFCGCYDRIAVDLVGDPLPVPAASQHQSGAYPLFGGARLRVYELQDQYLPHIQCSGLAVYDNVTSEFARGRVKIRVLPEAGSEAVAGDVAYERLSDVIVFRLRRESTSARSADLHFSYNCGALGTYNTDFTLRIAPHQQP